MAAMVHVTGDEGHIALDRPLAYSPDDLQGGIPKAERARIRNREIRRGQRCRAHPFQRGGNPLQLRLRVGSQFLVLHHMMVEAELG